MKFFHDYMDGSVSPEQLKRFSRISHQLAKRKTNNFNIPDLLSLIKHEKRDFEKVNRKIMIKILQKTVR